jgi:type VI secretion system protein ImpB
VEVGGAIKIKELPFVMGVLGDYTGHPREPLPAVRDRKFVEVNPDNFDSVLKAMNPHLTLTVKNRLESGPDAGNLRVDLDFHSLEDFEPQRVAGQVPALKKLLDAREALNALRATVQGNDKLENLLLSVVQNSEKHAQLRRELDEEAPAQPAPQEEK